MGKRGIRERSKKEDEEEMVERGEQR